MKIVKKELPITEFERKEREQSEQESKMATRLPAFLLKAHIRRNLNNYRKASEKYTFVQPECRYPVAKERYEIQGHRRTIGLSVYHSQRPEGPTRTLFYFIHGGGFVGGGSKANDNLMRLLADRTGAVTASVDYTLSPEAKYPEGLLDCQKGLEFLLHDERFDIDPERVILSGDSAGGNLAGALALKLTDEKSTAVYKQVLLYPVTDLAYLNSESYRQKGVAYRSMYKLIQVARDMYLNTRQERYDPYVSLICADINAPKPDALLLLAEIDGLRGEAIQYGGLLAEAGTSVRCIVYKDATHAFINNLGRSHVADDAAEEIVHFITN